MADLEYCTAVVETQHDELFFRAARPPNGRSNICFNEQALSQFHLFQCQYFVDHPDAIIRAQMDDGKWEPIGDFLTYHDRQILKAVVRNQENVTELDLNRFNWLRTAHLVIAPETKAHFFGMLAMLGEDEFLDVFSVETPPEETLTWDEAQLIVRKNNQMIQIDMIEVTSAAMLADLCESIRVDQVGVFGIKFKGGRFDLDGLRRFFSHVVLLQKIDFSECSSEVSQAFFAHKMAFLHEIKFGNHEEALKQFLAADEKSYPNLERVVLTEPIPGNYIGELIARIPKGAEIDFISTSPAIKSAAKR